jgi:hypothetical protein
MALPSEDIPQAELAEFPEEDPKEPCEVHVWLAISYELNSPKLLFGFIRVPAIRDPSPLILVLPP